MTDSEILCLVSRLEECRLSPTEFHHRDHLAVCVAYLYSNDLENALVRMRTSLTRLISHHGLKGYHESITRFWIELVQRRLNQTLCLSHSVQQIQDMFGDKNLIQRYYSAAILNSSQARETWVEPDLIPLI